MTYVESLQRVIRKRYGCGSEHISTSEVRERRLRARGGTVWKGKVELFDLVDHPTIAECCAWGPHPAEKPSRQDQIVTVLGFAPVDSPRKAVQVALLSEEIKEGQLAAESLLFQRVALLIEDVRQVRRKTARLLGENYILVQWIAEARRNLPKRTKPHCER